MTLPTVTGVVAVAVADAIHDELDQMGAFDASPGMAAVAYDLAVAFDSASDAPTSKAVVARELSAVMVKLRALATPAGKGGALDELNRRREERLAQRRERAAEDG
ncbi:hypothetical protein ACFWM0_25010 [Streptomyces sp. NPDC058405]|uniref:hypothetical protein n=1 Tax=Streptomyces sp. NPDC058405 TaxID=3346482 RepID=UPI00366A18F9